PQQGDHAPQDHRHADPVDGAVDRVPVIAAVVAEPFVDAAHARVPAAAFTSGHHNRAACSRHPAGRDAQWAPALEHRFSTSTPAMMRPIPSMPARSIFCRNTHTPTRVTSTVPAPDHTA